MKYVIPVDFECIFDRLVVKGSPSVIVKVAAIDLEIMDSSCGNNHLQKCRILVVQPFLGPCT